MISYSESVLVHSICFSEIQGELGHISQQCNDTCKTCSLVIIDIIVTINMTHVIPKNKHNRQNIVIINMTNDTPCFQQYQTFQSYQTWLMSLYKASNIKQSSHNKHDMCHSMLVHYYIISSHISKLCGLHISYLYVTLITSDMPP